MLKVRKKRSTIVTLSMLSVLLLFLFLNVGISFANEENKHLEVKNLNFQMIEFSDDKGKMENISKIEIELPSSTWNVTDIELNFSNIIYYERETKIIEEIPSGSKILEQNGLQELGVQIKLNDTTTIIGVYIKIDIDLQSKDILYIQICGYDSLINAPNNTIYVSEQVDSNSNDWYYQEFSTPVSLPKGNFSLVMKATDFQNANSKHYWYYNDTNPNNPDLYSSENDGFGWTNGIQGSPFLYKLDQKAKKRDFYPEKYNMTAEVNGSSHKILNDVESCMGNLKLSSLDLSSNGDYLHIPINNNKSNELYFDLNFGISLKNEFSTVGSLFIKKSINEWSIIHQLHRNGWNYSVKFKYPNTWENISIFKDDYKLIDTIEFIDNGQEIIIMNETITQNADFRIEANSIKNDPLLSIQKFKYSIGEEILIEVSNPIDGKYIFVLYALGVEKYRDQKSYPTETIKFSYNLTSTTVSGNWTAFVYWNNETDAGVQTQEFEIHGISPIIYSGGGSSGSSTETKVIEPISGIIVSLGIIIGVGSAGSLIAYQTLKNVKKKRDLHLQALYNKFKDNLSLNYLMISDHKSGLNVYEQFFAGKSIDPSLLSGFLEAIRNFGMELTGSYKMSETVKLEYQNSKILMNERKDFRLILIMSDDPSEAFKNSITNLANEIEKKYGHLLREFKGGEITQFSGIKELIETHLNVAVTYPLRVVDTTGMKLTRAEKLMIQRAKSVMKQTNLSHFFTSFLMPDQQYDPEKTKTIFNLIDKGIFRPISLNFKK